MRDDSENYTIAELYRRSKYGLGDRRTFQQLMDFSGVNPAKRLKVSDRCGNIDHLYVPFTEHVMGVDYIPAYDSNTFNPVEPPDRGSIYYHELLDSAKKASDDYWSKRMDTPNNFQLTNDIKDSNIAVTQPSTPVSSRIKSKAESINNSNQFVNEEPNMAHLRGPITSESEGKKIIFELLLFVIIFLAIYFVTLPSRSLKKL
jgi:hypothetical protein